MLSENRKWFVRGAPRQETGGSCQARVALLSSLLGPSLTRRITDEGNAVFLASQTSAPSSPSSCCGRGLAGGVGGAQGGGLGKEVSEGNWLVSPGKESGKLVSWRIALVD